MMLIAVLRYRRFIPLLPSIFSCNVNLCPNSHAIAFSPCKFQKNPMISSIGDVAKKLDLSIEHCDHRIDASVIE